MSSSGQEKEPLKIGDIVLDRYRVDQRLAAGGHSIVYRGVDQRLSRPVCIKAFHGLAEDRGIRATVYEHFVQEAFALSKLTHPNTLRIYDFGYLVSDSGGDRLPVQVSEFMAGGTLASLVRDGGRLETTDALAIIGKLGDALAEAHRTRIVHRDIKPQNILFTSAAQGRQPKLADFGIAKSGIADNVQHQANETRVIAGFPLAMYSRSWAAPEQLCGEPSTPAADLYSLGLVAIFALTGKAICNSASAREGYERRRGVPALIERSTAGLGLPEALIDVLQAVCAFDKADRPGSAQAFISALQAAIGQSTKELMAVMPDKDRPTPTPTPAPTSTPLHLHRKDSARRDSGPPKLRAEGTETTGVLTVPIDMAPPRIEAKAEPELELKPLALRPRNSSAAPSISLRPSESRQHIGSRACEFIRLGEGSTTLHVGGNGIELTSTPNPAIPAGRSIMIKGLSSFVAPVGGRPSRALILAGDAFVDLMDPRKHVLGRIRISFGEPAAGSVHFQLGNLQVAVDAQECPRPILIDSPTHHQSFLLYGLGSTEPSTANQRY